MKKALCLFLALLLSVSAGVSSFAEISGELEYSYLGLRFNPPDVYRNTKGIVAIEPVNTLDNNAQIVSCSYYAVTEDRYHDIRSSHGMVSPGETWIVFLVFCIGRGMTFSEYNTFTGKEYDEEYISEIGKAGDFTYYLYMEEANPEQAENIDPAYRDDYITLAGTRKETEASFTFFKPEATPDPYAGTAGSRIEFTTTDLEEEPVSSAELFAQNDITVLNIWTTWCGPCIGELEDLQGIHKSMRQKGVGVVGMMADDDLETARALMDEFGVAYPVILVPDNLDDFFLMKGYPTTLFIGKDGTVLSEPVIGAQTARYKTILNELLRQRK